MSESISYSKQLPVTRNVDVLVVGAGPAGIAAAIASARNGALTLLVEKAGTVGGMATIGLVGPFMTSFDKSGERQIIVGIFDELVRRMEEVGAAIHPRKVRAGTSYCAFIVPGHDHCTPFDPEWFKVIAADMLQQAGVDILLHTQFLEVLKEGGKVVGGTFANKSGIQAFRAMVTIDCTGDADVSASAGVPYVLGRTQDGKMQPATMFFRVCGVDSDRVKAAIEANREKMAKPFHGPFNWVVREARERGEWRVARDEIGMYETSTPGEWRINTTRILNVDGTSAEDLTRAEIDGRKQAREVFEFLKKHIPGCENARLVDTGSVVGIRETRHIVGEYVVTKDDVLTGRMFDDAILLASNSVDIHSDDGHGGEYLTVQNGNWYSIPYRSLVPLEVDGLLVAGRSISATSEASSAFRVMPPCFAMGQAAGTAAALCAKTETRPRDANVALIQKVLKSQGVYLGD